MEFVDLVIKNCRLVRNGDSTVNANIYVLGGRIAGIGVFAGIGGREELDAQGLIAIPGGVDGHVHMMDPGFTVREEFSTGTAAAAYGGTTTVMEHHRTDPPVVSKRELLDKKEHLSKSAVVDFALKGGVNLQNWDLLKEMWDEGVTAFKMFTCQLHGADAILPGHLYYILRKVDSFGGTCLIHCEEGSFTKEDEKALKEAGRTDYLSHTEWRSLRAEILAVRQVIYSASLAGGRVVVAHNSNPETLMMIREARLKGIRIYAESCPHYFYLTTEHLKERGPWVKFAPAVRDPATVESMWEALKRGLVDIISSDHCPYEKSAKLPGEKNIWDAPNGIPGVETTMRLMLTGAARGKVSLSTVIRCTSTNPARLYGLYPRKGALLVGSDADIVLVDMKAKEVLSNDKVVSKCGWTPFDGFEVQGIPITTLVRGNVVVRDREIVGKPGYGQFVRREFESSLV